MQKSILTTQTHQRKAEKQMNPTLHGAHVYIRLVISTSLLPAAGCLSLVLQGLDDVQARARGQGPPVLTLVGL